MPALNPTVWDQFVRVLSLSDYNTRVVILGTTALGTACGVIGSFMLLRKRSLMADAVSHATLPGIALAFVLMVHQGGTGKWLPGLLLGALITGLMGMGTVLFIRSYTRVKEDAALGIVLSVYFGFGVAILGMIQKMSQGSAAGLGSFIYGKTASMLRSDAQLIGAVAVLSLVVCGCLFKEFTLLCFDQDFAGSQGWPVMSLDIALMSLVVLVTVIGLQAVGLILVIALLIIPPAAARFWTEKLKTMTLAAAALGAAGGAIGASLSAIVPRLPAGAIIVITYSVFFLLSLVFGRKRGLLVRTVAHYSLTRKVGHQHLLRALYENAERLGRPETEFEDLLRARSWSGRRLKSVLAWARRDGVVRPKDGGWCLTEKGETEAARVVRNHRLWEMYLITYADIAPSHVDRDADQVEHVLDPVTLKKLEDLLLQHYPPHQPLPSPHALTEGPLQ